MDLVEKYLSAVRWNLPAGSKGNGADDIIAELRDLIGARIEDREEALDRALTQSELSALLKEFGHPLAVASGYRQHQVLIGPELFPFWFFSIRVVLLISGAVQLVIALAQALTADRAFMQVLAHGMNDIGTTLLLHGAGVTLIFAIIERTGWMSGYFANWRPEELPELRVKPKRAWESVFEIGVEIAFLLWWAGVFTLPVQTYNSVALEPAPIWTALYWPIFALIAAQLVHKIVRLARPHWTAIRAALSIGTTLGGITLLALLHQSGRLVTVLSGQITPERATRVQASLDHALYWVVIGIGAVWAVQCLNELWRLARGAR